MLKNLHFITSLLLLCFTTLNAHSILNRNPEDVQTPEMVPCSDLNNEGFESGFGIWIDGGSNCARSTSFPNTGAWSVELRSGVGLTSSMYTPAMNWTGMGINLSFSFYPQGFENGEGLVLEYAKDVNGTFTGYTGWIAGNQFVNNTRYNVTVNMNNIQWTSTSRLRLRTVASATDDRVYIDDVVISNCCEVGATCNDGNACTINDVIQSNCQCAGTWQDSDSDGTCDAFDICPGEDDYLIISEAPCDDGDPCTEFDHMDSDVCGCQGQFVDWDHDGYCHVEDPNDLDACVPDPQNGACNPCIQHDYAHFESNFGNWNSGGNDCSRQYAPQYASAGNYCVRLRDNDGMTSSLFSDNFNLAGANHVSVRFSFIAVSFENGEDFFLDVSTNGGSSYTTVESWSRGTEFQNNTRYWVFVPMSNMTWTSQTRFRIRCDASANDDNVYIDDIYIKSCENYPALISTIEDVEPAASNDGPGVFTDPEEIVLSPNPTGAELRITGIDMEHATIDLFNVSGTILRAERSGQNTLDVSALQPGIYFVRMDVEGNRVVKRFIKE